MNDDLCGDWYEPDEEYNGDHNSQFPRTEDDGGWGIDENMYTSTLDKSKLTPEQIAMAERIASEIERDARSKNKSTNMGGVGGFRPQPAATYAESQTASFLQQQKSSLPPRPPQPPRSQQQQQQQPNPRPPSQVTPPAEQFKNECKVVTWLQAEMMRVLTLIGTHGDPTPQQASTLLNTYTMSVTTQIPFSPPEVKTSVVFAFNKCNWDVLKRRPTPGSRPPNGKTLCDLIFELGVYFCSRTNQPLPPTGFVELKLAEYHAKRAATTAAAVPANRAPGGGGGKGYQPRQQTIPSINNSAGKGGGKGYHGNNGGKGGKGGTYNNYNGGGKGKGKGERRDYGKGGKGGKGYENKTPR